MRGTPVRLTDFSGGLNVADAPYAIENNQSWDARNVVADDRGTLRRRYGHLGQYNPASGSPFGIYLIRNEAVANAEALYAIGSFAFHDSFGGVQTNLGPIDSSSPQGIFFLEVPGSQGPYWMVGSGPLQYWTGVGTADFASVTATSGAIPANPKYAVYTSNRVFVANITGATSRLQWSNLGDSRAWPSTNYVDFDPNDGETITGLTTLGPYLVVFKRSKVWIVYDLNTGANRRLQSSTGCAASRSAVETPLGLIFLGSDGRVYVTDGAGVKHISENIDPLLKGDTVYLERAAGAWNRGHYYLSFGQGQTQHNKLLDYDSTLGSWWLHDNGFQSMDAYRSEVKGGLANGLVGISRYTASSRGFELFNPSFFTDSSLPLGATAYWKSRFYDHQAPYVRKRLRQLHFDGYGPWSVYLHRNFIDSGTLVKSGLFASTTTVQEATVPTPGVARSWCVEVREAAGVAAELDGLTLNVNVRKD